MSVPAVELRDVRKNFGRTEIIRGVDLSIARGERHAIIGPNGAGKTTLFNLISGRFPISSGLIAVNGRSMCWPLGAASSPRRCRTAGRAGSRGGS